MLSSMRFKHYIWPYNPKTFEMEYRRKIIQHRLPFSGIVSQNMGTNARVFKGEGEFTGKNAYEQFKALANVFSEDTPGILTHPLWPSVNVYFTKLVLKQEPQENYVKYSFEFEECPSAVGKEKAAAIGVALHRVASGETMGAIAANNNTSLDNLIVLNPGIKNPNIIAPGTMIRIYKSEV